ncbi:hypothetical protein CC80DRAFT_539555 [Byssothecium circinans]|uniref:Fungal N-terminal domain-containing protein n=1 Tax=Byssothecium circinans TaxID=147558 RepID=A0A6A5TEF8_9PLEO|nr:hypothetical protein CC80DRAFT_539555 [Byssothecium circinans]
MSFGYSVGDVIALGKLIADISSCLQSSGGSKSEYQELQRELDILHRTLYQLDQLPPSLPTPSVHIVKCLTLNCRSTLEQFITKTRKYERSLGVQSQPSMLRGATDKIRWGVQEKDEVRKLQAHLNTHNSMIHTHLLLLNASQMNAGFMRLEKSSDRIQEVTEDTQQSVNQVFRSIESQRSFLYGLAVSVPKILSAFAKDFGAPLEKAVQMLTGLCYSVEQIHAILVRIRPSATSADTRWTFFQEPIVVEDAFGIKFPVPSEYDSDLLQTIVAERYLKSCSVRNIDTERYELFLSWDTTNAVTPSTSILPGSQITMAIPSMQNDF